MQNNWREEPVLQFKFMTMEAMVSEVDEDAGDNKEPTYSETLFFDYDVDPYRYWPYALKWHKKAALQKEPLAVRILQQIETFRSTECKALAGDADAQYLAAYFYDVGYGTIINKWKCAEWLRKAAQNGNKDALRSIGEWNQMTKSTQKMSDPDFYAQPLVIPDDDMDVLLGCRHGRLDKEDREYADVDVIWNKYCGLNYDETQKAAESGDPEKQYQLAWLYDWGKGVEQDTKKAIEWFVRSAYNGYAPAQTELGILYHAGIMVTKVSLQVFHGQG